MSDDTQKVVVALNAGTYLKLSLQSPVPARGSANSSPKEHVARLMCQDMQWDVLEGQGSFSEEAVSELSSKGQGDGSSRWVVPERQPHTMGVQKSGVMEERTCPVARRTKAPGIRPVPCWRDVGTRRLCAASVQAVWGLA